MRSACVAALLIFAGAAVTRAAPAPAPAGKLHPRLQKSINAGVAYLGKQQRKDGGWEATGFGVTFPGGVTSLSLLALLECGVSPKDPVVQKGLAYLRKVKPSRTYVVALQTMVFVRAGQSADSERIQRNVNWLLEARNPAGWTYGKGGSIADNSNSRFALLALHEAIGAGIKVDRKALEDMRRLYAGDQGRDGAWGYRDTPSPEPRMTMTAGCLGSLLIAGMHLDPAKVKLRKDGSAEDCGKHPDEEPIAKALTWIGERFPATLTRGHAAGRLGSIYYSLHALERAGQLSGQRYFGGHDWYEVGCRFLIANQEKDGSWGALPGPVQLEQFDLVRTSFALLFLAHGRTPVLVSKLAYGGRDYNGWNNKRNDLRHLVEFAGREVFGGAPVGWKVFDVRREEADMEEVRRWLAAELARSPVVYFNGHDYAPGGKERDILKEYLARGGVVLAEACCGDKRFDRDFRALMKRLFPGHPLKPLPATHPVWKAGKFAVPPRAFPLEGIEKNGRTVVIYSPVPLAGYWEANDHARGRGQLAFRLGANILAYATGGRLPPPRGQKLDLHDADRD